MFKVLFVLVATACVLHAAPADEEKKDSPVEKNVNLFAAANTAQSCYFSELQSLVSSGMSVTKDCVLYNCQWPYKLISKCGAVSSDVVATGYLACQTLADNTQPFPGCCPKINCPKV